MKNDALRLVHSIPDPTDRLNILREYIQALILRSLHESQAFTSIAFVGGTALRFLFNLPRFSEDLDFSLELKKEYRPVVWMQKVKRDLHYQGYDVLISWNDTSVVNVAWVGIPHLLKEAGLSGHSEEKLSVKLEFDTNPPKGAVCASTLINRHTLFAVRHYDLPSLMAGKVNALLTRSFCKGRDWYDLVWYRSRRPPVEPNLELLRNALAQQGVHLDGDWRTLVRDRIKHTEFEVITKDVAPFLESHEDAKLLRPEYITALLEEGLG